MVLGRLFKLHPDFYSHLATVLLQLHQQTATLSAQESLHIYFVFIAEREVDFNKVLLQRLEEALLEQGCLVENLPHHLQQIRLIHYDFYAKLLSESRIVLDTYPYGGCISTHDSFFHGIPVVTLPSSYIR
jgi:hypothetical protein